MTLFSELVILACPACTYNRVFPTWFVFASLRLLIVLAVSYRRLDLVRTLGAFVAFEVAYFYAWGLAVWYSHPSVADGFVAWVSLAFLIILSVGVPAVAFLLGLARLPYFRAGQPVPLTRRHALLLVPAMFLVAFIQVIQGL
jgi:hypothetical protein